MPFDTRSSARPLRRRTLSLVILAGLAGESVFEVIAWGVAPLALGRPMQPAILVADLARALFGAAPPMPLAFGVHLASGIVLFPFGYLLFRSATGMRSPALAGLLWGVILWLGAQAVLAPLAGRPFMLGYGAYTWGSLGAHVVYALAVALAYDALARRMVLAPRRGSP